MKVEKLDRIHVVVKDLDKATKFFSELLGTTFSDPPLVDESISVKGVLSPLGLELVQSTDPDSAFAKFVEKRGEGLFSLCFKVPDIEEAIEDLTARGLKVAARMELAKTKDVQFHPKDSFGVIIVLTEYPEIHGAEVAGRESQR